MISIPRRFRLLVPLLAIAFVVFFIFTPADLLPPAFWRPVRSARQHDDFYDNTVSVMDRNPSQDDDVLGDAPAPAGDGKDDNDNVLQRVQDAEREAKRKANEKSPLRPESPDEVVGVGSAADKDRQQQQMDFAQQHDQPQQNPSEDLDTPGDDLHVDTPIDRQDQPPPANYRDWKQQQSGKSGSATPDQKQQQQKQKQKQKPDGEATPADKLIDELLADTAHHPILLFSKTYCPYSLRAKYLLFDQYRLTPPPHVIELDTHPLGPDALQTALARRTGRRTVPNIIVQGVSLGGFDELAVLETRNVLVDEILKLTTTNGEAPAVAIQKVA